MDSSVSLDDITGLFGAPPQGMGSPSLIVQGIITSFSTVDGSNTVLVNGGVLTNVPMLLTGAEVNYTQGDPVLLIVLGNTYMILGKVAGVATPQYASASATTTGYFQATTGTIAYSPSAFVTLATANITVPTWSNRMTFAGIAEAQFIGTSGLDVDVLIDQVMNGNDSGGLDGWSSAGGHNQVFSKFQSGVQTVIPGSTITATCRFQSTGSGNIPKGQVSGICLFSKI